MALLTWALMAVVLVIVMVLVALKVTRGATALPAPAVGRAPASVVAAVAGLPAAAYDVAAAPAGADAAGASPTPGVQHGQGPVTVQRQPAVVFVGAEFSPYSAALSWALVAALDRFGSFSALGATASSSAEVFARTPTFTFDGSAYRSRYLTLVAVEQYGASLSPDAPGGFPTLDTPGALASTLLRRYDAGAGAGGALLPFADVDNQLIETGAGIGFSPGVLQGLSMAQVASDLADPSSPVARAVLGAADELDAAMCAATGGQPGPVCDSAAVKSKESLLGLG